MADGLAPLVEANGARIPAIGLGTWPMKGAECQAAVEEALAAGYRHIDTAEMYGNEEAVGAGLRASGPPRDEVFLTTKIWRDHLAPEAALKAARDSVGRLGVEAVDLLLIHWPDASMTPEAMIASLLGCKQEGLARHVGVSNFPAPMMEAAAEAAGREGETLVANQCEHHPELDQSRTIAACRERGMAFVSYSPLGKGASLSSEAVREVVRLRGKTPAQVVLRWHVQRDGVVAIPKSSTPERIRENIDVFDFTLTDDEMRRISGLAHPQGRQIDPDWAPDWSMA